MKLFVASAVLAALAGCATATVPAGMPAGKFVTFACADGKSFSARAAQGGESVRVRAHHGAAELERKADGVYEGDGYKLVIDGAGRASLLHGGKAEGQQCRQSA